MDHEGDAPPPFWFQPPASNPLRQRRRSSSPTLNPVAMIILVPILVLLVIALILIPLVSHASQFLKTPNSLKKGWDSLNILLVLFAILCGVFLRQNNEDALVSNNAADTLNNLVPENASSSSSRWFENDYNDQKMYNSSPVRVPETGGVKLMRSSRSYPDLRQEESLWQTGNRQYRFYDDFDLNIQYRSPREYSRRSVGERDDSDIKVIPVDTFVSCSTPPPKPQQDPLRQQEEKDPPPQQEAPRQPRPVNLKRRRSVKMSGNKENIKRRSQSNIHIDKTDTSKLSSSPPQAAAAPPPPQAVIERHQEKSEMLERKKSGATKEIATAIASLYNRTKKKKHKVRNIYDNATTSSPPTNSSKPPLPPPPPPSVFHNMFKKGNKSKKIHSVAQSVQSPPETQPPPPNSIFNNIFKNAAKSKRFNSTSIPPPPPPPPLPQSSILNNLFKPATTSKRFYSTSPSPPPLPPQSRRGKPPLPTKTSNYYENLGSQSPVVPIPPPPPPPPFKMRQVKFEARGDFVRIKSGHGSRSNSPELEDVELASNAGSSVFCPSPDVNTKADNFIARLRDEWRLEKMNSIRVIKQ